MSLDIWLMLLDHYRSMFPANFAPHTMRCRRTYIQYHFHVRNRPDFYDNRYHSTWQHVYVLHEPFLRTISREVGQWCYYRVKSGMWSVRVGGTRKLWYTCWTLKSLDRLATTAKRREKWTEAEQRSEINIRISCRHKVPIMITTLEQLKATPLKRGRVAFEH